MEGFCWRCQLLLIFIFSGSIHGTGIGGIRFPRQPLPSPNELRERTLGTSTPMVVRMCTTPDGKKGQCLPLDKCPQLLSAVQDKGGLRNQDAVNFLKKRICGFKGTSAQLCCSNTPEPLMVQPKPKVAILPSIDECGFTIRRKVILGREFSHGSHPWLAGIGYLGKGGIFKVTCGGTLITRKHVLSAAHCFYKDPRHRPTPNNTHVILGEHSLSKDTEMEKPLIIRIQERKELGYNFTHHYHDISLIILKTEVTFTDFIRPACLPFQNTGEKIDLKTTKMTIAGWGKTDFYETAGVDVPLEGEVSYVPRSECKKAYQKYHQIILDETQVCFGNDGVDGCQGDSGGPLLYVGKRVYRYFVIGIIGFGIECGSKKYPTIYTYVPSYLNWIQDNLQ